MSTKVRQQVRKGVIPMYKDAKKRLTVEVHKLDVKHAKCHAPDECVIAKAIARQVPDAYKCWVYKTSVYVAKADLKTGKVYETLRYVPSKNVKASIDSFDAKKGFKTGKYYLDVPVASNALEGPNGLNGRSKRRGPGRHKPTGKGPARGPTKEITLGKKTRLNYSYKY